MKSPKKSTTRASTSWSSGSPTWVAAVVLALLIAIVYVPAVHVPLIYDDYGSIIDNPSIQPLWPLFASAPNHGPLNPPPSLPTSGRPLANLTFALNLYFGGMHPAGYHLVNIVIHFLASLFAWAITRRTLRLPYFDGRFQLSADWIALAVATLWAMHPLQTEAVIYATQRTELMMGLFYLATIYCSLRYWSGNSPSVWLSLATLACLCGMASKEVMASAPVIVLLFDRTFIAGSLARAIRNSWPLYLGLAATWILLIATHVPSPHSDAAGFSAGVPAIAWWLTQSKVLLMYLKLAIWPWPLLIHYQPPYLTTLAEAWPYVIPVFLLGATALALLWRNMPLGFLGAWFFAILSPTLIVPLVNEIAAERRMYLALLPLIVIAVVGGYRWVAPKLRSDAKVSNPQIASRRPSWTMAILPVALLLVYCLVSATRLTAYQDDRTLWLDVLKHNPDDPLARLNKAVYLERAGNLDAAIQEYREAIRLDPAYSHAHYNLGILLNGRGASEEAAKHLAEAARYVPKNAIMRNNIGVALYSSGQNDKAIDAFQKAIELDPSYSLSYKNLGTALLKAGRYSEAATAFETFLQRDPDAIEAYLDLANVYVRLNQRPNANVILQQGLERARTAGNEELAKKFADKMSADQ